jgi:hypothetical protein
MQFVAWNITNNKISYRGEDLLPQYGRARASLDIRVPKGSRRGVYSGLFRTLDRAAFGVLLKLVRSRHLNVAVLYPGSPQMIPTNWERFSKLYNDYVGPEPVSGVSEDVVDDSPEIESPAIEIEPIAAAVATPIVEESPEEVPAITPPPLPTPVSPVVASRSEDVEESPPEVSLVNPGALSGLVWGDLSDEDKLEGIRIRKLRKWGRAFSPRVTGTSKKEIAEELLSAGNSLGLV